MSVPLLRPLSLGEILDVSLKIWRHHFPALARIVAFVVTPVQILSTLLLASVVPEEESVFAPDPFDTSTDPSAEIFDGGDAAAFFAGLFLVIILSGFGSLLASAAVLRAVTVAYLGGTPDWKESLRLALRRFGSLVGLAFLMGLGMALGFGLCIAPGVWLAVAWALGPVALLAENCRPSEALVRSFSLVRGRWWATCGVLLIAFALNFVVDQIIAIPFAIGSFISTPDNLTGFTLSAVTSIISDVITTPFVSAVFVLVYFDLRVRKEGFDLELLAQAMGPLPEVDPGSGTPYTGPAPGPMVPPGGGGWQQPPPGGWGPPGSAR